MRRTAARFCTVALVLAAPAAVASDVEPTLLRADAGVGSTLSLPALDGAAPVGRIARVDRRGADGLCVTGTLEGDARGTFVLARRGDAVAGHVRLAGTGEVWSLRGAAGEPVAVERHLLPHHDCEVGGDGAAPMPAPDPIAGVGGAGDDGSVIDVLFVYPTRVRVEVGSTDQVLALIDVTIAETNETFVNSGITTSVALAYAHEFSGEVPTLGELADTDDGVYDAVHVLRDAFAADMVSMLDVGGGGVAQGLLELDPSQDARSFCISRLDSLPGLVVTHELGHNLGCCHAVGDGGGCGVGLLFSYSNGWRWFGDSGIEWRTVMAYAPGERLLHMSTPDVLFDGQPTGQLPGLDVPGANNASTVNSSFTLVANFRYSGSAICDGATLPPDAPDCNANNLPDSCEIALGLAADADGDGVPDDCEATCPADVDGDGSVDIGDLNLVLQGFGCTGAGCIGDVTGDGATNALDLNVVLAAFGTTCG